MGLQELSSLNEFNNAIRSSKLTVVDFYSNNCPPCKHIAPFYAHLSSKYPSVHFIKVEADRVQGIARSCKISIFPTFHFYKNNQKLAEMQGADPNELESLVQQHGSEIPSSSTSGTKPSYIATGYEDISTYLSLTLADCLNQNQNKTIQNLLREEGILESDVDEQLLISVAFNQAVKLHSIKFFSESFETAPKRIKLFVNRVAMGFDEVDSIEAVQELELSKTDFEDTHATSLRFVKFQSVNSLTIFVENNQGGGEITQLRGMKFIGLVDKPTKMPSLPNMTGN